MNTARQLYTRSLQQPPRRTQPEKELLAFIKVKTAADKEKSVILGLDNYSVSFYDSENACWRTEKGEYEVLVGLSSADINHRLPLLISGSCSWIGV
jgi:beta-glucosidase